MLPLIMYTRCFVHSSSLLHSPWAQREALWRCFIKKCNPASNSGICSSYFVNLQGCVFQFILWTTNSLKPTRCLHSRLGVHCWLMWKCCWWSSWLHMLSCMSSCNHPEFIMVFNPSCAVISRQVIRLTLRGSRQGSTQHACTLGHMHARTHTHACTFINHTCKPYRFSRESPGLHYPLNTALQFAFRRISIF